jgi:hypothetical protein
VVADAKLTLPVVLFERPPGVATPLAVYVEVLPVGRACEVRLSSIVSEAARNSVFQLAEALCAELRGTTHLVRVCFPAGSLARCERVSLG